MLMTSPEWQQECADGLRVSLALEGAAGLENWSGLRQKWLTQKKGRVILADLDLTDADLRDYDLSRCWIGRTSLIGANLSGANFSQAIFRECDLTGVNIRGTNFYAADLDHPLNRLIHTHFDDQTNMEINEGQLAPEMDRALIDMAEASWRRTRWRRKRSGSIVYKFLKLATDHGFSVGRVFVIAAALVVAFSILFKVLDESISIADSALISVRYFLGLDDHYAATNYLLSLVGIGEATLGLVFLSILIAVFTSKFTDL
jgi:hypothetical protein